LFGVQVVRVTDAKVLSAAMERVNAVKLPGGVKGEGTLFAINNNAQPTLATLRYKLKDATMDAAEEPFEASGTKFNRGTILVKGVNRADLDRAAGEAGVEVVALGSAPDVKTHPLRAARVAFVHTWLSTQTEGWWRLALDNIGVPYDYMSTQAVGKIDDLRAKYDVILFPPVGFNAPASLIISGLPTTWGNPLPWKNTAETPNLVGKNDSTDDMRPGLGWQGLAKLQEFVAKGGVLLTATDTSNFAISSGFENGVTLNQAQKLNIVGSVLSAHLVDSASPIAYGYSDKVSVYCDNGPIFSLTAIAGERRRRRLGSHSKERPTGRGTIDDPDFAVGRPATEVPEEKSTETWEIPEVTDEQKVNNPRVIPDAELPRVILRYADSKDLLVSGLLEGGDEIAQHPAVVDVPSGAGHVILFSINPVYRGETRGTYSFVLNTIMNWDSLNAGRKPAEK